MSESSATETAMQSPIDYADHMTISCSVSDLERSIAWYRELLGFELIYKLDDMGWCSSPGRTARSGGTAVVTSSPPKLRASASS
jgi:Glyoxalase/Bleomycin resistance protein/Dioxygenase superfamily